MIWALVSNIEVSKEIFVSGGRVITGNQESLQSLPVLMSSTLDDSHAVAKAGLVIRITMNN